MGSTSGALVLCLSFVFLFTSVRCRPQKDNKTEHHLVQHNSSHHSKYHPYSVRSTEIHLLKPSALAIYHSGNGTVVRPLGQNDYCPRDAMKMHVCVHLLKDIFDMVAGRPGEHPCCSALFGLIDIEAAMCLCTTIKFSVMGITIDLPIKMTLLLNYCQKPVPKGFTCQ